MPKEPGREHTRVKKAKYKIMQPSGSTSYFSYVTEASVQRFLYLRKTRLQGNDKR